MKKLVNNRTIAYLCGDGDNENDYRIADDGKCYYNDKYIGDVHEKQHNNGLDIYFKPILSVKHIDVKFTITPNDCYFK